MSAFELWHQKKNKQVVKLNKSERMEWGNRLENAIAAGFCEDRGLKGEPFKYFIMDTENKIGSSFDWRVEEDGEAGLLEIKNVDSLVYRDQWIEYDNGVIEAPPHIEMQIQHQLAVSDFKFCYLAALVGGNRLVVTKRIKTPTIEMAILNKARDFWKSIENNTPPEIDFERDASYLQKIYNYAEPRKILETDRADVINLAMDYHEVSGRIKELEKKKDGIKAHLLTLIEDAEKVKTDLFTISAGVVGESEVSYVRKPYRSFRISWKKQK